MNDRRFARIIQAKIDKKTKRPAINCANSDKHTHATHKIDHKHDQKWKSACWKKATQNARTTVYYTQSFRYAHIFRFSVRFPFIYLWCTQRHTDEKFFEHKRASMGVLVKRRAIFYTYMKLLLCLFNAYSFILFQFFFILHCFFSEVVCFWLCLLLLLAPCLCMLLFLRFFSLSSSLFFFFSSSSLNKKNCILYDFVLIVCSHNFMLPLNEAAQAGPSNEFLSSSFFHCANVRFYQSEKYCNFVAARSVVNFFAVFLWNTRWTQEDNCEKLAKILRIHEKKRTNDALDLSRLSERERGKMKTRKTMPLLRHSE